MLRYMAGRTAMSLLILVSVSILTFAITQISGDPAAAIAGESPSPEVLAAIRRTYGFDRPLVEQYLSWAAGALRWDFGVSYHYHQPVAEMIGSRLPVTLLLGGAAMGLALLVAIPLGVLGAYRPNGLLDRLALVVAVLGQAIPTFWLAMMLIVLFGVTLQWLPVSGTGSLAHLVLPTIALGVYAMPPLMRLTRAGMLEVLTADFIRTARAKGLSEGAVVFKHGLRNAIIPVVALASVQLGMLLGGSIVVETIFALQGVGWLGYDAMVRMDLPVVQAIVLVVASAYILLTWAADLLNAWLDPRIRTA